jgi:hypothetical protein
MNRSANTPSAKPAAQAGCWSLEVVRGRAVGQAYALVPGETILGNAPAAEQALELADQEGRTPRKMAARHAALGVSGAELTIRDLESPGGTFVNQQRLLSGQARRLVPGDVIQLGGVQLVVKLGAAAAAAAAVTSPSGKRGVTGEKMAVPEARPPAGAARAPGPATPAAPRPAFPASAGRLSAPYTISGGGQARVWNDFLVLAAQNWAALRDELMSGRLAEYLRRIHCPELVPRLTPDRSADDQLDEWLGRLPATGSSAPELDVHPETVVVRAATGGGVTKQTLRITNVGYRLLRCQARVEPPGTRWVRIRPEHDGQPFATIDQTDVPIEVEIPETFDRPLGAAIVIDSNGGTRRVTVRIERPADEGMIPDAAGAASSAFPLWRDQLKGAIALVGPGARIALCCAGAIGLRLLAMVMNAVPFGARPAHFSEPKLSAVGLIFVALGVLAGLAMARRRGERDDYPAAAFAGGSIGLLSSAFLFALLQTVERLLGPWSSSIAAIAILWGLLGALFAFGSLLVIPHRSSAPEAAR